jgi:hypothetical protein
MSKAIIRYETERPVDEIYVESADHVHLERMDYSRWYLGIVQGGKRVKVSLFGLGDCVDMRVEAAVYEGLEYLTDDTPKEDGRWMSDEKRNRAREVLAQTAFDGIAQAAGADLVWLGHGCGPEAVTDCYAIADRGIAALDAADIRLAGEGEVVMDANRLDSLEHLANVVFMWRNLPEHADDLEALTNLIDAADAVDPIGGSDGGE